MKHPRSKVRQEMNTVCKQSNICLVFLCLSFIMTPECSERLCTSISKHKELTCCIMYESPGKKQIMGQHGYINRINSGFVLNSTSAIPAGVDCARPTLMVMMLVFISVSLQDSNKYSAEIVTSPSLDVFLPEDEDNPYESVTTAVTRKPCSLDISHRLNACTGNGRK